jgi:hypothetical protein
VADSGYSALDLLHSCQHLANPVTVVTRLRLDAALYESAPLREPGQIGRPALKGKGLPILAKRLNDPKTTWHSVMLNWYEGKEKNVEVTAGTAVWYHTGKPLVSIR